MIIGKSAKLYQERRGLRSTLRGPGPRILLDANKAHTLDLVAPLPLPDLLQAVQATQPPAAGLTQAWPHGTQELWIG